MTGRAALELDTLTITYLSGLCTEAAVAAGDVGRQCLATERTRFAGGA
jgi:hypothetical protein